MSAHMIPIKTAAILFIFLVFLIFIPWLILHYRKYRYFSLWHTIVIFSFIFYSISALFLVLLPLPQIRDTCALQSPDTVHYILKPFNFLDGLKELNINWSNPRSYISLIREQAFLEPFFNMMLLVPLGVYIRYFFPKRRHWRKALLIAFSVSMFFEITQLTGIYGIYNCPYRLFDVDDLFFNTIGAVFGFFLAPILLALFPSKEDVLEKSEKYQHRVTPMIQLLALMLDLIVVKWLVIFVTYFVSVGGSIQFIIEGVAFLLIFVLIPLLNDGKTIGSAILRFNYRSVNDEKAIWRHFFKRFIAIYIVPFVMAIARYLTAIDLEIGPLYYKYEVLLSVGLVFLVFVMWFLLILHGLHVLMKKGKRAFYFDKVAKIKASRPDE